MSEFFTLDLRGYRAQQSALVPNSTYRVVVDEIREATSKSSDNRMYLVWLRIIGGQYDGEFLVERLVQSEGAMFRSVQFLNACGVRTKQEVIRTPIKSLRGKQFRVTTVENDWNGNITSQVAAYLPLTASDKAAADADVTDLDDAVGTDYAEPEVEPEPPAAAPAPRQRPAAVPDPAEEFDAVSLDDLENYDL